MHLLPRDEKFFTLLIEHSRIVLEASSLLTNGLRASSGATKFSETARQIRNLERKADEATRNIYCRLHKTFITPIDPEDVYQLASRIDEILDHLDTAAYCIEAYALNNTPEAIAEIAGLVNGCINATVEALETLQRDGTESSANLVSRCEDINQREFETEERVRLAIRALFANERDAITLIKQKEIYEILAAAAKSCESVAEALEAVAVKNS